MKSLLTKLSVFFLGLVPFLANAQFQPQDFGKITPEEIALATYSKDSSAAAVVLFDTGEFYYNYLSTMSQFRVIFKEHKRLKILKKDGYDYAQIKIPVYGGNSDNRETIARFRAYTYNFENGKVEKLKVEKSSIVKEKVNDNVQNYTFAFPNVKEGSIVEYEIAIESGYDLNINDWNFQSTIPVCWSEYTVSIPEYYVFNKQTFGYIPFKVSTSTEEPKNINFGGGSNLLYNDVVNHFVMQDVPAFKVESYLDCMDNYLAKVTYELRSIHFPGAMYHDFNTTWQKVATLLLDDSDFGNQLKARGFFKDDLTAAIAKDTSEIDKLNTIFNLVKGKVKWNDKSGKYTKDGIKKAYKDGVGNSAEINLLLVAMLKEAGIAAYPVVLSTRDNGVISYGAPSLSKINYVVGLAEINGNRILLDATQPFSQVGVLPFKCLNDKGRIIDENLSDWVELIPSEISKNNVYVKIDLQKDGSMNGEVMSSYSSNLSHLYRTTYLPKNDDERLKSVQAMIDNGSLDSLKFENLSENLSKPVVIKFSYTLPNKASVTENNIFVNPFIWDKTAENPFKLAERTYPINFGYPSQARYSMQVNIPEGYEIEELPQNMAVTNESATATIKVSYAKLSERSVMVTFFYNIGKPIFVSKEYAEIKEFFNTIVKKQKEMIVLKKS